MTADQPTVPPTRRIAAFDVDGTLTRRDCVFPFVRRIGGTGRLARRLLRNPIDLAAAVVTLDRNALKAVGAMAAFEGESAERVESEGWSFAHDVVDAQLRDEGVAALRAHLDRGDRVVFVSASFEVYLRPLATLLGVDGVLATRLEVGPDDLLTGRLAGENCRGPEKVRRLHEWLDTEAGGRRAVHVTAYGDSNGDREFLRDADDARWMGRGAMPRSWTTVRG